VSLDVPSWRAIPSRNSGRVGEKRGWGTKRGSGRSPADFAREGALDLSSQSRGCRPSCRPLGLPGFLTGNSSSIVVIPRDVHSRRPAFVVGTSAQSLFPDRPQRPRLIAAATGGRLVHRRRLSIFGHDGHRHACRAAGAPRASYRPIEGGGGGGRGGLLPRPQRPTGSRYQSPPLPSPRKSSTVVGDLHVH